MRIILQWRCLGLGLLALMFTCWAALFLAPVVPRVSEAHLRNRVEREIPPGTSKEEVAAWLRANGSPPIDGYLHGDGSEGGLVYFDEATNTLSGEFSKYYFDKLRVIRITFHFDDQGQRTEAFDVSEYVYDH